MATTTAQLSAAITASQLQFNLTNIVGSALPAVGAPPLSVGVPFLMDGEYMYCISQPVAGTVVVRGRGSEGSPANPHDALTLVYASTTPSADFGAPPPGIVSMIDPGDDLPTNIGQDSTLIIPATNTVYSINKATAAAITLPAPPFADNGLGLTFTSLTAAAHVITATGLFSDGSAGSPKTTATFAAQKGATLELFSYNGLWSVASVQNVTIS